MPLDIPLVTVTRQTNTMQEAAPVLLLKYPSGPASVTVSK